MSCQRIQEIDLAGFLASPRDAEFASFREHYPVCAECAAELRAWTELEIVLRGPADPAHAALGAGPLAQGRGYFSCAAAGGDLAKGLPAAAADLNAHDPQVAKAAHHRLCCQHAHIVTGRQIQFHQVIGLRRGFQLVARDHQDLVGAVAVVVG